MKLSLVIITFQNLEMIIGKIFISVGPKAKDLHDGELNPGLPRDWRGYLSLYYRGLDPITMKLLMVILYFPESWKKDIFW